MSEKTFTQNGYTFTVDENGTVTAKGQVTAKKNGKCYIYAYAQNGVCAGIKITVK